MNYLKSYIRQKLITGIALLCILTPVFVFAQNDQQILPDLINEVFVLEGQDYVVQHNVKVTSGGLLVVQPGTSLLFSPKTTVIVEGGLIIEGENDKPVLISSVSKANEGFGFEISSIDESSIKISNATFTNLILPLIFSPKWYRANVEIQNNSFMENRSGESGIIINRPDELLAPTDIQFDFSDNVFANNSCNIYIYDVESNVLDLSFTNNLITQNTYKGFEVGGENKSPVYVMYNASNTKYESLFSGNAIMNNFLVNDLSNTLLTELNFGIAGLGDKFSLANNYFGDKSKMDIQATFDHFSNNNSSPYIEPYPFLTEPPAGTHAFVWKTRINGEEFLPSSPLPVDTSVMTVVLHLNKPVQNDQQDLYAEYLYYDKFALHSRKFLTGDINLSYTGNQKVISFQLNDSVFLKHQPGYLVIGGLKGLDNFLVPFIEPGKNYVFAEIEKNRKLANQKSKFVLNMVQHKIDSLKTLPGLTDQEDSVLLKLTGQLEYINELTTSALAYDSLIMVMTNQLDSINTTTHTRQNIDKLSDRLKQLKSLSNQNKRHKKDIKKINNKLDSLKLIGQLNSATADSLINLLSERVENIESYSLAAVFKPLTNTWEIGGYAGQSFYTGDLYYGSFNSKYLYLSLGGFVRYNYDSHLANRINYNTCDMGYTAPETGSFITRMTSISILGEYTFLAEQNILNPFIGIGPGLLLTKNSGNDELEKTNNTAFSLPIDMGLKIKAAKNWRLSAELMIVYPFDDSIDGASIDGNMDLFFHAGVTASWLIR